MMPLPRTDRAVSELAGREISRTLIDLSARYGARHADEMDTAELVARCERIAALARRIEAARRREVMPA